MGDMTTPGIETLQIQQILFRSFNMTFLPAQDALSSDRQGRWRSIQAGANMPVLGGPRVPADKVDYTSIQFSHSSML